MTRLAVFLVALVLLSGQAPAPVGDATRTLIDQGVLGAICVLLMVALVVKDRQVTAANTQYVAMVMKLTEVVAKNSEALRDVETSARFPVAR